ncbi:MAG: hypothetical protein LBQ61_06450 [Spirochaetales bacterium]|jgi:hypothetical protein|nr:hypothetical protein [Spirochaetales bacterium]
MTNRFFKVCFSAFLVSLFILFGSCLALLENAVNPGNVSNSNSQSPPTEDLGWLIGKFVDEWGDETGDYFIQFNKRITGAFTTPAVSNANLGVSNVIFSEVQGLTFEFYKYGRDAVVFTPGDKVSLILRYANDEKTLEGKIVGIQAIALDFNDDLVDMLSLEENINFRVTVTSYLGLPAYYQFNFEPKNFVRAYEGLKNLGENITE